MSRRGMVIVNPILPSTVREDQVRLNMLTAIGRVGAMVRRDFQRTVATWNHPVKFSDPKKTLTRKAGQYGFSVTTEDEIWGWLNEGTDVRYKTLSENWISKTTPDSFESGEGDGFVVGWGHHEGIQARNWTRMAENIYERILREEVTNAVLLGLRNQRLLRGGS